MSRVIKLSIEEYHATTAVSRSDLSLIARSPAHYFAAKQEKKEPTAAMRFGQAVHDVILEPEIFKTKYVVAPLIDRRTKAGKEEWEAFQILNSDKNIITAEEHEVMSGILKSVISHDTAKKLLNFGKPELSYFWMDKEAGVECKCRPDFLRDGKMVVDVKTTEDASPEAFQKSLHKYGYHNQAAWYLDGVSKVSGEKYDNFIIVAVEKAPPYAVAVYLVDDMAVEVGRQQNKINLLKYAECLNSGNWPSYDANIQSITLPPWATKGI